MHGSWLVSYIILWVVVALLILLVLGLAREIGLLHRRLAAPGAVMTDEGLKIDEPAPGFQALQLPEGREVEFTPAGATDAVIVFLSTECGICRELMPGLMRGWAEWKDRVRIALVCEGDENAVRKFQDETGVVNLPLFVDPNAAIRTSYGISSTPHAFLLGRSGTVRLKGGVNSRDDIDRMVEGEARLANGQTVIAEPTRDARDEGVPASASY